MNFILHKHNKTEQIVKVPEGIKELMADMTREILRDQPENIYEYTANYLDAMMVFRENTVVGQQTVDSILDCSLNISDLLQRTGISLEKAEKSALIIQNAFKTYSKMIENNENDENALTENEIIKKLKNEIGLTEEQASKTRIIMDVSFKNYFYSKIKFQEKLRSIPRSFWKKEAERTIDIYRNSCPSQSEMNKAAVHIQSVYRGYYTRRRIKEQNALMKNTKKCMST